MKSQEYKVIEMPDNDFLPSLVLEKGTSNKDVRDLLQDVQKKYKEPGITYVLEYDDKEITFMTSKVRKPGD